MKLTREEPFRRHKIQYICHYTCTLTAVYFTTVSFICSKREAIEGDERKRQTKMAGDLFTRDPNVRGQHRSVRRRTCEQRVKVP